ncbi:hypothetical protein ANCCAN_16214 [Ancylostoma caninum]|uniref:Uncharacterized protein n=1 Tax=Ancylostoma caninum TaxID=29170 RepID=A0A368G4I4_ANCCA|nr:hypothetical protein ANCCAN_16214 [Ancylostoma caninum]
MKESTSYGRFDDEMDEVRRLAMSFPKGVQFEHVYAHDGDPGNEQQQLMLEELVLQVYLENASEETEEGDRSIGTEDGEGGRTVGIENLDREEGLEVQAGVGF